MELRGLFNQLSFAAILLSPLLIVGAALSVLIVRRFGKLQSRRRAWLAICAIGVAGNVGLYAYGAFESIVVEPARLQRDLLGRIYAGPSDLVGFRHDYGFVDFNTGWAFRLEDDDVFALRRRCLKGLTYTEPRCTLYHHQDDRVMTEVWLDAHGVLHISDGVW